MKNLMVVGQVCKCVELTFIFTWFSGILFAFISGQETYVLFSLI